MKVVYVIAPDQFKDVEYFTPKKILEENGIEVVTASLEQFAKGKDGADVEVDILLEWIKKSINTVQKFGLKGQQDAKI